jgi:hypothetical protein
MCPKCGGSLQQRFLKLGCLSTAPKIVLVACAIWAAREILFAAFRG